MASQRSLAPLLLARPSAAFGPRIVAQRAPHRSLGLLNGRYSAIAEPLVAPLQRRSATTGSSGQPSSAKGSEEVRDAIKGVVSKYVTFPDQAAAEDWIKFEMTDLSIKFKIVKDCMDIFQRRIHSVDLTNMLTVRDLVRHLEKPEPRDPLYGEDTVEKMFRETPEKLPPNMSWVSKDRRELLAGTGSFSPSGQRRRE